MTQYCCEQFAFLVSEHTYYTSTVHAVVMIMEMSLIDRGLRLRVLVLMAIASSLMANEENVPVEVNRRLSDDIYYLNTVYHSCQDSRSYLVSEDRCVENQEFFSSKAWTTNCK